MSAQPGRYHSGIAVTVMGILGTAAGWPGCGLGAKAREDGDPASEARTASRPQAAGERVLARVAGRPIFEGEVVRAAAQDGIDLASALEGRVRFELLARAAEAASSGSPPEPEARDLLRRASVERLVADTIEPLLAPGAIPEPEVRAFYDRVRKRFVHGRLVQVAVLCIFTGARMKPAPRARAAHHADALRAYLGSHPGLPDEAFLALGRDPAWTEQKVSFSATTVWQDAEEPFPPVVGQAVARLAHRGDTTEVVGDETGYYVARYLAERPPENVDFAAARPVLAAEMWEPWRRQKFVALTLDLARSHEIEAFPESFPALVTGPGAPAAAGVEP